MPLAKAKGKGGAKVKPYKTNMSKPKSKKNAPVKRGR